MTHIYTQAMVQMYSTLSTSLWWLMLTATLFWRVQFPFHSRSFQGTTRMRCLHVGCGLIGALIPLTPVVAILSAYAIRIRATGRSFTAGGMGFGYVRFPPLPCNGRNSVIAYYSMILPTNIMLGVGITLTIFILRRIHKVRSNSNVNLNGY